MKRHLYEMSYPTNLSAAILEEMRQKCAGPFGVTLVGNRLTLRWYHKKELVQVHMIIDHVEDGEPEPEEDDE